MEVDVDGVEAGEEVDKGILLLGRDVGEKGRGNGFASGEGLIDREVENEGLGIDIANINSALVCEEDLVSLTLGVDTDIIFGVGGMREEGLNNEVVQGASDGLDLIRTMASTDHYSWKPRRK